MRNPYVSCPVCHRDVRVRKDGRLYRHLKVLADKHFGAAYCSNTARVVRGK